MAEIKKEANIKKSQETFIEDSIMTGISYMIPIIAGGDALQVVAEVMGGYDIGSHMQEIDTLARVIMLIGQSLMNFTTPAIAVFIVHAMADKPGIASGPAMGVLTNPISIGSAGGVVGGLLAGYIVIAFRELRVSKALSGIMLVMIISTFATLISDPLMHYVLDAPIEAPMGVFTGTLLSLGTDSKSVMDVVIGVTICFDHGGPINKTVALFVNGLNADGFLIPISVKMCVGMTAPLGTVPATVLGGKKKLGLGEREQVKPLAVLSCCYAQEGIILFLMKDPVRVAISCTIGGVIIGGLYMIAALEPPAVHGGAFVTTMTFKSFSFIGLWALGACATGVLYTIPRKPPPEGYVDGDMDNPLL